MRSLASTFALVIFAGLVCAATVWQWRQGNFDAVFGSPPTPVGEAIYSSFKPDQVKHIRVSNNLTSAMFSLQGEVWQASTPWVDRMDPRAALGIINFTLGMRVEDYAPVGEIDARKAGLTESGISIRLEDAQHNTLAKYKMGRVAPWKAQVDGAEHPIPTVYVQPKDKNHKDYIYACTGDINSLFKDGLKFLRDHHPFSFNPYTLQKIRIHSQQGDLTLGRENPKAAWRIIKPLDLATNAPAIKSLLEGLFEIYATKVSDGAAVTLPSDETADKRTQIGIIPFGSDTETILTVFPPESPESIEVKATVNNRPNAVLLLPLKPEPGLVSLADLPLSVNDLRDPTLTHLSVASLSSVAIQPSTGSEIIITRTPPSPWKVEVDGVTGEANEENLFALLKAVTTGKAIGFESDAATDFTPWGLERPFLKLGFLGQDDQGLVLRFGMDGKGNCYVNRLGSPSVMRIDPSLIASIVVRPYEWRHARLWSLDRVNLLGIERKTEHGNPMVLKYKFIDESWKAEANGEDISANLDANKANFMLSVLEGLKVSRWLSVEDAEANNALVNPEFSLKVIEKTVNAEGEFSGVISRSLDFTRASGKDSGFYYGRLDTEKNPFLLDAGTYQKLSGNLFDKE
ncbi:MAG: DUF4340 domain-containing protein [Gloeobacteraceae cyanobacterium ES-bin-144]|nr:DUF4340 domain-containing protein [Verrucomicrobiales bacterium]